MGHIIYPVHFPYQGPETIVLWGLIHIWSHDESSVLVPAWISNYMYCKVWDEITYPFENFNGTTVEIWEWISSFIPHLINVNPCYTRGLLWTRQQDHTNKFWRTKDSTHEKYVLLQYGLCDLSHMGPPFVIALFKYVVVSYRTLQLINHGGI